MVATRTAEVRATSAKLQITQFAMDSVGIGIHWLEAASGRLIYVNRYAAELLGYGVEDMLRLHVSDIDPKLTPQAYADMMQMLRRQRRAQFETWQRTRDGGSVAVEMTCYYLPGESEEPEKIIALSPTSPGARTPSRRWCAPRKRRKRPMWPRAPSSPI